MMNIYQRKTTIGILMAVFSLSLAAGGAEETAAPPAERTGNGGEENLRLNFRGARLDTILDYLSEAAGFVIILKVDVDKRIDVWSHQPLSKDEAINLLNTVLNENGYAAIRNGRTLTIVDREEARMRDLPVRIGNDPERIPRTDEMVTQIIAVRYADATQMIANLSPLIPSYATIAANESSNAIVLTDTQTNVRRMAEIVRALDTSISSIAGIRVFPAQLRGSGRFGGGDHVDFRGGGL